MALHVSSTAFAVAGGACLFAVAMLYYLWSRRNDSGLVSPETARRMIASGEIETILDVCGRVEYRRGHHPHAVHVPAREVGERHPVLAGLSRLGPVLVYCDSTGERAREAARLLGRMGFGAVYRIAGTYRDLIGGEARS